MRLAIVPQIETPDASLGGAIVRRPDLPAEILARRGAWGQASSALEARGRVVVWLDVTDSEAAAIARRPGCDVRGRAHPLRETRAMRAGMDAGAASARREWVDAYRRQAAAIEDAERRRAQLVEVGRLVALFGAVAVTELVLTRVLALPPGVSLAAFTMVSSETWMGDAWVDVQGTSMDAARGGSASTWAGDPYFFRYGSNRVYRDGVGTLYDSTTGVTSDNAKSVMRVGPSTNRGMGPAVRVQTSDLRKCYMVAGSDPSSYLRLWRLDSIYGGTQLGSDGPALGEDDEIAVVAEGSSISGYLNGTLQCGPSTDSNYASGALGISWWGVGSRGWWEGYTEASAASGSPTARRLGLCKWLRPVEIGRSGAEVV